MMDAVTRIFLVEDDLDDQDFFTEALGTIQNTILMDIAKDGEDALAKLRALPLNPDIIFMDINMPGMNGIDCLKEIKLSPKLKSIPVVILSTYVDGGMLYSSGAQNCIRKPMSIDALRNEIDHALHLEFDGVQLPVFINANTDFLFREPLGLI